ncbi:MAG: hypothetical protein NTW95_07965, partial [Candidatus Aminicenantes bacterium]|nr:hypothetical protein [Candidatus Aminicenantes bacterium]
MGANKDGWYIMDKNGTFMQKLPRKSFYVRDWIFPDNKRIFYTFWENKKDHFAMYSLKTRKETVLPIDPSKELFVDISLQGEILFFEIVKIAKKVNYSFFLYDPENGSRTDLGMTDQRVCYEDGDNRFL